WIGNCFLLLLNVPLVRIWLSVFKIKYSSLFPAILFFCCIGTYSINSNIHDIYTTALFGVFGYVFLRFKLDAAPLILGFILGAMLISRGSFEPFIMRPISGVLISLVFLFFVWQVAWFVRDQWRLRAAKQQQQPGLDDSSQVKAAE